MIGLYSGATGDCGTLFAASWFFMLFVEAPSTGTKGRSGDVVVEILLGGSIVKFGMWRTGHKIVCGAVSISICGGSSVKTGKDTSWLYCGKPFVVTNRALFSCYVEVVLKNLGCTFRLSESNFIYRHLL